MAKIDEGIRFDHVEPLSLPGEMSLRFRVHYDGREGRMVEDVVVPPGNGGSVTLVVKGGRLVVSGVPPAQWDPPATFGNVFAREAVWEARLGLVEHEHAFLTYRENEDGSLSQECACGAMREYHEKEGWSQMIEEPATCRDF